VTSSHLHTGSGAAAAPRQAGEAVAHSTAFEVFARAGFVARASIYAIIGILAIKVALGSGGKTTNQKGALETIAHQPFGKVLLILTACGLGGYAAWRLTRAALGHGPEDTDSTFDRIAAAGSGVVYALLFALAIEVLTGSSSSSSGNTQKTAAGVFGWPGGVWLVGAAGVVLIGVGLYQGYRGVTQDFLEDAKTEQMGEPTKQWVGLIGTIGHLARGVVFVLVGVFLLRAAIEFDPNKAVGLDGALAKLAAQPYGSFLLGTVAAGLIAFAVYSVSDARYRRI
jgi:Domain of Unknown Function (DUF1206)